MFSPPYHSGSRINSHERLPSIQQALREVDFDSMLHFQPGQQFPVLPPRHGVSYPPQQESWAPEKMSWRASSVDSASFTFSDNDASASYGERTSNSSFSITGDDESLRPRAQRDDRKVEKERDARKGQQDVTTFGEDAIENFVPMWKFRTDQIESNANRSGLHHTKIEIMTLVTGLCIHFLNKDFKESVRYSRSEEWQLEMCNVLDRITKHGLLHGTMMDGAPKCYRAQRSDAKMCELHGGTSHRHCRKKHTRELFKRKEADYLMKRAHRRTT